MGRVLTTFGGPAVAVATLSHPTAQAASIRCVRIASALSVAIVCALAAGAWAQEAPPATQAANDFDRVVAPLLTRRCLDCHRGIEPKGGLDLSRRETALAGGDSGPVIVPSMPDESLLWQYIDGDQMPPEMPLPAEEKEILKNWVAAGAAWGSDPIDPYRFSTDKRAGNDFWSLQPIGRPQLPGVPAGGWARNAIDSFVVERLEQQGLRPSGEAEPRVLVRRLYFDLIGLPPPPEMVDAFVARPTDDAWAILVDRLLASPQYGERWSRHWLDVVRYGESDGFERNFPRANAWRYRDWVIAAFNGDMPYDRFAKLQLAGDVLDSGEQDVLATGFLVAGVHNTVVPVLDLAKLSAREDELEDIVSAVGQTWLGLTIQCARCHDHKFDPVGQRDYYRLVAALAGVQHGERAAIRPDDERARLAQVAQVQSRIAELEGRIADVERLARERARARLAAADPATSVPLVSPVAQWTFDEDADDRVGGLKGTLEGGATIAGGRLHLDGKDSFASTEPLKQDLGERTLEAWVALPSLDQGGGGVVTVEAGGFHAFDSIVYAERQPRRWIAGSSLFQRTLDVGQTDEMAKPDELIHMAIVYRSDNSIALFRNGQSYASPYTPTGDGAALQIYRAGDARVLFGLRHHGAGNGFLFAEIEEARIYDRALSAEEISDSAKQGPGGLAISQSALVAEMSQEERRERDEAQTEREGLAKQLESLESPPMAYAAVPQEPPVTHLLLRGNVTQPQDEIAAGGVAALGPAAEFSLPVQAPEAQRRVALARWITAHDNPLFSRVIVNRLWQAHFGAGIVETPSDLGFNGGRPSHPQLLDWLASELVRAGYSLKAIQRLIVTSSTYRQESRGNPQALALDGSNRLLWRKSPVRLEAEALRDSILVVSGQWNASMGGPGFKDVRTYENNGTTFYEPIDPEGADFQRRTIYRFSPRGERSSLLDTFDCPDPSVMTPRRQATTTPLQALSLLNNSFVLRMSEHFAHRVIAETAQQVTDNVTAQVTRAYRLALGREPLPRELVLAEALARKHGMSALCRALFNTNEFVVIE